MSAIHGDKQDESNRGSERDHKLTHWPSPRFMSNTRKFLPEKLRGQAILETLAMPLSVEISFLQLLPTWPNRAVDSEGQSDEN